MGKAAMKSAAMKKAGAGAMKRVMKAKKVSKIAKGKHARASVFSGRKEKTVSGMTKDKLTKNKSGRIVSKKASARAKRAYASSGLKKWADAVKAPQARRSTPRPRRCWPERCLPCKGGLFRRVQREARCRGKTTRRGSCYSPGQQ